MADTSPTSNIVGKILNTRADNMKFIPLQQGQEHTHERYILDYIFNHICKVLCTVEHLYNKPEILGQPVCYVYQNNFQ